VPAAGTPTKEAAMDNAPNHTPQAVRGYPVDVQLRNAHRAQRGQRRGFAPLRVVTARLRRTRQA
jgi:hypothetical protein